MLDRKDIIRIVKEVATATFAQSYFEDVLCEPATDSEGRDALRITIVLRPNAVEKIKGDETLDVLFGVQNCLRDAGEERFPIVEYATRDELEFSGDPEP